MKVLASILPFLAQNRAEEALENEQERNEDCVMMIDVVSGEKLCVKNPEMGLGDLVRGKRKQAKGKGNNVETADAPESEKSIFGHFSNQEIEPEADRTLDPSRQWCQYLEVTETAKFVSQGSKLALRIRNFAIFRKIKKILFN